jgi:hypothetical protein
MNDGDVPMAKGDTSQKGNTDGQNAANKGEPRNPGLESFRSDAYNDGFHKGHDSVTEQKKDK